MFNLKKARAKPTEKMLIDHNDSYSHHLDDPAVITDKLLDEEKKLPDGQKIVEKQLSSARNPVDSVIAEKQLNSYNGMIPTRRDDGIPLMDMANEYGEDERNKFSKENKANDTANTSFWDYYLDTGKPKIINNVQPSQLLSNYKTRDEMNKKNPSFKKAMVDLDSLKDADAMLYHLYRQAAVNDRELSDIEKQMVRDINATKIKIIAYNPNAAENDWRSDQSDITGDQLEEQSSEQTLVNEDIKKKDDFAAVLDYIRRITRDERDYSLVIEPEQETDESYPGEPVAQLYFYGTYSRSSVLEGQPRRRVLEQLYSWEDAKDLVALAAEEGINIEISSEQGQPVTTQMPTNAPEWFDPSAAGERWDEDY